MSEDRPGARSNGSVHDLATSGSIDELRALLESTPDLVSARGRMGRTALFNAADQGHLEALQLLIEGGADVAARSDAGDGPLHWAATTEIVEALLEAGAEINQRDELESSPLHWAARRGRLGALRALLEVGADAKATNRDGATALHGAENADVAATLLAAGAPLDRADRGGRTPLWLALWDQRDDVARELLEAGADTCHADVSGVTPGHLAHTRECLDVDDIRANLDTLAPPPSSGTPLDRDDIVDAEHLLVRVHPIHAEALSICGPATLVRWSLTDETRVIETATTDHEGIAALDISPDGALIALMPREARAELRSWNYPTVVAPIAAGYGAHFGAFQPRGDLLAIADGEERILLWDLQLESIAGAAFVPARTTALAFSPEGDMLAVARKSQSGAGVTIIEIDGDRIVDRMDHALSDSTTEASQFVEEATAIDFSPDGGSLAIWQTSTAALEQRTPGWLGEVLLLDVVTGQRRWRRAIDDAMLADLEFDVISPDVAQAAPLRFCDGGRIIVIVLAGVLLFIRASDGVLEESRRLVGTVHDLAIDRRRGDVLIAGDHGLRRVPVPRG